MAFIFNMHIINKRYTMESTDKNGIIIKLGDYVRNSAKEIGIIINRDGRLGVQYINDLHVYYLSSDYARSLEVIPPPEEDSF